jgi:hypothetical protein
MKVASTKLSLAFTRGYMKKLAASELNKEAGLEALLGLLGGLGGAVKGDLLFTRLGTRIASKASERLAAMQAARGVLPGFGEHVPAASRGRRALEGALGWVADPANSEAVGRNVGMVAGSVAGGTVGAGVGQVADRFINPKQNADESFDYTGQY